MLRMLCHVRETDQYVSVRVYFDIEDEFDGAAALNWVLLAGSGVLLVEGGVPHIGGGPPAETFEKAQ